MKKRLSEPIGGVFQSPSPPLLRLRKKRHGSDRCRDDAVECSFDPPPEARPIKPILVTSDWKLNQKDENLVINENLVV